MTIALLTVLILRLHHKRISQPLTIGARNHHAQFFVHLGFARNLPCRFGIRRANGWTCGYRWDGWACGYRAQWLGRIACLNVDWGCLASLRLSRRIGAQARHYRTSHFMQLRLAVGLGFQSGLQCIHRIARRQQQQPNQAKIPHTFFPFE